MRSRISRETGNARPSTLQDGQRIAEPARGEAVPGPREAVLRLSIAVVDRAGDAVGTLRDIIVDMKTGLTAYGVVALLRSQRLVAVPWKALTPDGDQDCLRVGVSRRRLEQAPALDPALCPRYVDRLWSSRVYADFATPPYWEPAAGLNA